MQTQATGQTDTGQKRERNEDAFLVDEARSIFAVADGLGGLPGGQEVSNRVIELIREAPLSAEDTQHAARSLTNLIFEINRITIVEGDEAHPFTGSGTTLSVCQLVGEKLNFCHIGDSAIYILRDRKIEKLTHDHTMESDFIEEHGEAARAIMPPEYPHTLTRCIGQNDDLMIDSGSIVLKPGDRLLLCTDGLNKVVSETAILQEMSEGESPLETANRLIKSANFIGGPDNVTAIVVFVSE